MSTSGLTSKEERTLRDLLQRAEDLTPGRAYLGGGQQRELVELMAVLKQRLEPESAETLIDRAERMIAPLAEAIAEARGWIRIDPIPTREGADAA